VWNGNKIFPYTLVKTLLDISFTKYNKNFHTRVIDIEGLFPLNNRLNLNLNKNSFCLEKNSWK
jgi:hypothetical protein